jgi:hypothetical protein
MRPAKKLRTPDPLSSRELKITRSSGSTDGRPPFHFRFPQMLAKDLTVLISRIIVLRPQAHIVKMIGKPGENEREYHPKNDCHDCWQIRVRPPKSAVVALPGE